MKNLLPLLLVTGLSLLVQQAVGQHLPTAPAIALTPGLLVITNVNVVDVVEGEILPDRMVVIRDGYITSIDTRAPAGRAVQRLDGHGKYLVPGLWATHVQAPGTKARGQKLLVRLVAHGITSVCYFSAPAARPALLATQRAVEAGVQVGPHLILAGSRSGWDAPNQSRGSDLQTTMDQLVASGCSPAEALQAATVAPAAAAGYRYILGQVAPGFQADLVLLDANPLDDIHHLQQVRAVVLRGRVFDQAALQTLLEERPSGPTVSAKVAGAH